MKVFLSVVICFQLVFLPYFAWANNSKSDRDNSQEASNPIGDFTPFIEVVDKLENNSLNLSKKDIQNPFFLANQKIEIFNKNQIINVIDLNIPKLTAPDVVYTAVRIAFDSQKKELYFEGVRGMREDGSGAELVARQVISGIEVIAVTEDTEIVSILDSKGNLYSTSKNYLYKRLFKNQIPIVKNWGIQNDQSSFFTATRFKTVFLTAGIDPSSLPEPDSDSVVSRDLDGNIIPYKDGDLAVIYWDSKESPRLLGVFSRKVIYEQLQRAAYFILLQMTLFEPNKKVLNSVEELTPKLKEFQIKADQIEQAPNEVMRSFFESLSESDVSDIFSETESLDGLKNREFNSRTDLNTLKTQYEMVLSEYRSKKNLSALAELSDEMKEDLRKNVISYTPQAPRNEFFKKDWFEQLAEKTRNSMSLGLLVSILVGSYVTIMGYPFLYDKYFAEQNIFLLNWIYQNLYTEVMMNAEYRTYLVFSMTSLILLWPAAHIASEVAKHVIKYIYKKEITFFGLASPAAIRDFYKNWHNLKNWQRVTSFGLRIYFLFVYPYLKLGTEKLLRQKNLISALQNGLNPFEKITPQSELGKKLQIKESFRVGVNNPVESVRKTQIRDNIQGELVAQKKRATGLAWVISTAVVSARSGIDMATLQLAMEERISLDQISKITQDPRLKREWLVLTEQIYSEIRKSEMFIHHDVQNIDKQELKKFFDIATQKAKKISNMRGFELSIRELYHQSKMMAQKTALLFLMNGYKEALYLKKMFTNKYVTDQGYKEIASDHPMTVLTMGLVGDRADMDVAKELTAVDNAALLWTHPEHLYDMVHNSWHHFFVGTSRLALIYQAVLKASEAREYQPFDINHFRSNERRQGILSASWDWIKGLAPWNGMTSSTQGMENPNWFYYYWQDLEKRFATIQASAIFSILGRLTVINLIGHYAAGFHLSPEEFMTLDTAFRSFSFSFVMTFFYMWIWILVQRGNSLEEGRVMQMNKILDLAKVKVAEGLRQTDLDSSLRLIQEGTQSIFSLYEKYNKKDLGRLFGAANDTSATSLVNEIQYKSSLGIFSKSEYIGLLADFVKAMKLKDNNAVLKAETHLRNFLSQDPELKVELAKLNAQGLLHFSMAHPPTYFLNTYHTNPNDFDAPNKLVSWVAVLSAGIISTVIWSGVSVDMFEPSKITFSNISHIIGVNILIYASLYATLSRSAWSFFLHPAEKIKSLHAWFKMEASRGNDARNEIPIHSCVNLFN